MMGRRKKGNKPQERKRLGASQRKGPGACGLVMVVVPGHDATEDGVVHIEIEDLVGVRAGAGIRTHDHIALMEAATQPQLESVVVVVTRVLQDEVAAGQIVGCVVNKVVGATALHEFSLHEEGCRKFLFECNTPIQKVRSLEVLVVDREGGENRRWGWGDCATEIGGLAGGVEEVVLPLSGVRGAQSG